MNDCRDVCLALLQSAISLPDKKTIWKDDPFGVLHDSLREKSKELGVEFWLADGDAHADSIPSTSSTTEDEKAADNRVTYARSLAIVYERLHNCLSVLRHYKGVDEYTLLSLQQLATVSASFEFFILSGVLPFLENGVGQSAVSRSSFIKIWRRIEGDIEFKRQCLYVFCNAAFGLLSSNELLKAELTKRFASDIICASFQLSADVDSDSPRSRSHEEHFQAFLREIPRPLLISILTGLCKPRKGQSAPAWFQIRVGDELSKILVQPNGLAHLFTAYSDMGGDNWWQNAPLRKCLGRLLATTPSGADAYFYLTGICKEFVKLVSSDVDAVSSRRNTLMFCSFVEEMEKQSPKTTRIAVWDAILQPWEVIQARLGSWKTSDGCSLVFDDGLTESLRCMTAICNVKSSLLAMPRFYNVSPILLEVFSNEATSDAVQKVRNDIRTVLEKSLSPLYNLGEFLYKFVTDAALNLRLDGPTTSSLIEEVGEEKVGKGLKLIVEKEEDDAGMMRRLQHVCELLKKSFGETRPKVFLELLLIGVKRWTQSDETTEESPRFVTSGLAKTKLSRLHSHFIVGYCFEQLNGEFDVMDPSQVALLLEIVEVVLRATCERLKEGRLRRESLDVHVMSESDREQSESMIETARVCIGIASGLVLAATFNAKLAPFLEQLLGSVEVFVTEAKCSGETFGDSLKLVLTDAEAVLSLIGNKERRVERAVGQQIGVKKSAGSGFASNSNGAADVLEDVKSDEPALKGNALLRAARFFGRGDRSAMDQLERADFVHTVKDLVSHEDSYVYLAAINCLCEMVCKKRELMQDLFEMYSPRTKSPVEPEESTDVRVIRRGRIGEAIGKIFREFGELSQMWFKDFYRIFSSCLYEQEELIRASACVAMGDLIVACGTRDLDIDQLLFRLGELLSHLQTPLVRRASVDLLRQCIRATSRDVLQCFGGRLRDLRRWVVNLREGDVDDVVRLHCQLCIDELRHAINLNYEDEQSHYVRRINI